MSTWIYLVCTDHTPPIQAEDESGQHLYDLPQIRKDLADREQLVAMKPDELDCRESADSYYTRATWRFLQYHPKCNIEIRDEYDRVHPIEAPS